MAAVNDGLRNAVYALDENTCVYCGVTDSNLSIDHILPQSLGGPDVIQNLVTACMPCNVTKNDRAPYEVNYGFKYGRFAEDSAYKRGEVIIGGVRERSYKPPKTTKSKKIGTLNRGSHRGCDTSCPNAGRVPHMPWRDPMRDTWEVEARAAIKAKKIFQPISVETVRLVWILTRVLTCMVLIMLGFGLLLPGYLVAMGGMMMLFMEPTIVQKFCAMDKRMTQHAIEQYIAPTKPGNFKQK